MTTDGHPPTTCPDADAPRRARHPARAHTHRRAVGVRERPARAVRDRRRCWHRQDRRHGRARAVAGRLGVRGRARGPRPHVHQQGGGRARPAGHRPAEPLARLTSRRPRRRGGGADDRHLPLVRPPPHRRAGPARGHRTGRPPAVRTGSGSARLPGRLPRAGPGRHSAWAQSGGQRRRTARCQSRGADDLHRRAAGTRPRGDRSDRRPAQGDEGREGHRRDGRPPG